MMTETNNPETRVVVCDPLGFVGAVSVPGLGTFAPGRHLVSAEVAAILLSLPHFHRPLPRARRPKTT